MNNLDINNIIIFNNYTKLQELINNKIDLSFTKKGDSLISLSIYHKSLECFNLLINIPNYDILLSSNNRINGLCKAIEYYIYSDNIESKYYLNKLLDKNIIIDINSFKLTLNNFDLFKILFNKINKTEKQLSILIEIVILTQYNNITINILSYIYDYICNNNFNIIKFNNIILLNALNNKNIYILQYLESLKFDLFIVSVNNIKYPLLYYIIKVILNDSDNSNFIYEYVLNYYINNIEHINNIENINKLEILFNDEIIKFSNYKNFMFNINKIFYDLLTLNINYDTKSYDNFYNYLLNKIFNLYINEVEFINVINTIFLLYSKKLIINKSLNFYSKITIKFSKYYYSCIYDLYCLFIHFKIILPDNFINYYKTNITQNDINNIQNNINIIIKSFKYK
jgi:hypothetical protein